MSDDSKIIISYIEGISDKVLEQMSQISSLGDILEDIRKEDLTETSKSILIRKFRDGFNSLQSKTSILSHYVSHFSSIVRKMDKECGKYTIFNRNTRQEEDFPCVMTREEVETLYKCTGCSISFLKETDSKGNVIWEDPNPDRSVPEECLGDDESIRKYLEEDDVDVRCEENPDVVVKSTQDEQTIEEKFEQISEETAEEEMKSEICLDNSCALCEDSTEKAKDDEKQDS